MERGPYLLKERRRKRAVPSDTAAQLESWRRLLSECGRKPSRRRVHALRVATLRLQARVEHRLEQLPVEDPAKRSVSRWNKQAEKLREALSVVRETDVHLAKLAGLRKSVGDGSASRSRMSRVCLKEIASVEGRLERTRKRAAKKLAEEIDKRSERLERSSKELTKAPVPDDLLTARSDPGELQAMISGLAGRVPALDAKSLHEFRKRVKTVRYVAEMAAPDDAHCAQQVTALRTMQSALGDWHDCQSLSKEACRIIKHGAEQGGLVELLETLTGESLENALTVCRKTIERLMEVDEKRTIPKDVAASKRPAKKAEAETRSTRLRLA
ncbi:MAG TPA: CHAD domain-containing protein [Terracidiphilus sp.]|nr:CHAD domain-containing protein [Terracidiphilus sp.]